MLFIGLLFERSDENIIALKSRNGLVQNQVNGFQWNLIDGLYEIGIDKLKIINALPVGTYPINLTEEYGTVQANPGVQGNGVFPSFYAQMLEDGSLIVPLWLLVGGTVDVTKDEEGNAHLEVNAVNSYGVPVHIVYDGTPINTAVENTQSPMTRSPKLLRNGHLIIKNAGAEYNAQGMKL